MGLLGMLMWTWDYRGFLIEPVLVLLEHIFDSKIWMCDKSVGSADISEKKLGKVVYNPFRPESII